MRPRATNFHRDWSESSPNFSAPVTEYPPYDPPPVILAPRASAPVENREFGAQSLRSKALPSRQ